jgi:hypothetical protein
MLAIAALCFISRYWLSSHFGLYEDDYFRIPTALTLSLWQIPAAFARQVIHFQQGRPLHGGFVLLFAAIGARLHGLQGAYWMGYGLSVVNALLLFTLLRRAEAGRAISIAAAAVFSVYPGDVSEAFLTHALGVQPSLALVLLAMHAWLSNYRAASWALVILAVFCYETPVPIFAAAPLLAPQWNARQLLRHVSAMAIGLAGVGVLRKFFGEGRVAHLNLFHTAGMAVHNVSIGPLVSLSSFVWRPFEMAPGFDTTAYSLGLVAALIGFALFVRCDVPGGSRLRRLAAAGLAFLFLSYLLPVILDAGDRDGRASRVHYAASVGCAILVACMVGLLMKYFGRIVAASAMALLLGTSTIAGVSVQRDYQRSWELQRSFWQDVAHLCPDLVLGKVVFVEGFRSLPDARHLKAFEWHMPLILPQAYQFPHSQAPAPRLFLMKPDWRDHVDPDGSLVLDENTVVWPFFWEPTQRFAHSDLIVLDAHNGQLVREDMPGPAANLTPGILFQYLLRP